MANTYLLAIDQGTTSSRAIVFDGRAQACASAQKEFAQIYPHGGWVEHDPNTIWTDTVEVCRQALKNAGIGAADLAGCGITNQRETTVVWDRRRRLCTPALGQLIERMRRGIRHHCS